MKNFLLYSVLAFLLTFGGGVWYFSDRAESPPIDTQAAGQRAGGEMPPVFEGFIERWNAEAAKDIAAQRGKLDAEIKRLEHTFDGASHLQAILNTSKIEALKAEMAELETIMADGPSIAERPLHELPANLDWQDGLGEPDIGDPAALKGGSITLWNPSPFPSTLRPFGPNSRNYFNYSLYDNVEMRLVGIHPETGGTIPALAGRWAVGQDGRTVFFELHPKAAYSDGSPVRVRDYLLNICLRTSPFARDPYYIDVFRKQYSAIRTYGDRVIAVTLPRAKPCLPYMACRDFYPANPGFYMNFNAGYASLYQWRVPPTTGGYTVSSRDDVVRGRSITMRRVGRWWARDMKFYRYTCNVDAVKHRFILDENLAYELFRRGEIDAVSVHKPESWNEKLEMEPVHDGYIRKVSLRTEYPRSPYGVFVNTAAKPLDDLNVRLGLQHAMNMELVLERIFQGDFERLNSYASGYRDLTNPAIRARGYSPELARRYFARAGYTRQGSDGILRNDRGEKLEVELSFVSMSELMANVCMLLKQYALPCGIEIKLDMEESSVCSRKVFEKRHQTVFWAWPLTYPLPQLSAMFHSSLAYDDAGRLIPNTDNIVSVADVDLDRLLMREREAETYDDFRRATYAVQQRLDDLAVWVPAWEDSWARVAFWRWVKWPAGALTEFCYPVIYDPLESHLYWIDPAEREATLNARRRGIPYPEYDVVIESESVSHK